MTDHTVPVSERLTDSTCYVERSMVRIGVMGTGDEALLKYVDALPIFTAADFSGHAQSPTEQSLSVLVKQYAIDLRRNASGGDDYPYEYAKATADYLEELIQRAKGDCTCAQAGFPDSCDNCDGITPRSADRSVIAAALAERWPGDYAFGDPEEGANEMAFETADVAIAALSHSSTDYNPEFVKEILAADAAPPEGTITDISELDSSTDRPDEDDDLSKGDTWLKLSSAVSPDRTSPTQAPADEDQQYGETMTRVARLLRADTDANESSPEGSK